MAGGRARDLFDDTLGRGGLIDLRDHGRHHGDADMAKCTQRP